MDAALANYHKVESFQKVGKFKFNGTGIYNTWETVLIVLGMVLDLDLDPTGIYLDFFLDLDFFR